MSNIIIPKTLQFIFSKGNFDYIFTNKELSPGFYQIIRKEYKQIQNPPRINHYQQ